MGRGIRQAKTEDRWGPPGETVGRLPRSHDNLPHQGGTSKGQGKRRFGSQSVTQQYSECDLFWRMTTRIGVATSWGWLAEAEIRNRFWPGSMHWQEQLFNRAQILARDDFIARLEAFTSDERAKIGYLT